MMDSFGKRLLILISMSLVGLGAIFLTSSIVPKYQKIQKQFIHHNLVFDIKCIEMTAHEWLHRQKSLGGGGNSFNGFKPDKCDFDLVKDNTYRNKNGTYVIEVLNDNTIKITAIGLRREVKVVVIIRSNGESEIIYSTYPLSKL